MENSLGVEVLAHLLETWIDKTKENDRLTIKRGSQLTSNPKYGICRFSAKNSKGICSKLSINERNHVNNGKLRMRLDKRFFK